MVTTLYIVRHAQAKGNMARTFQGQINSDVSEAGEIQLSLLKKRFEKIPVDVIATSPLVRAKKTAEAILAAQPQAKFLLRDDLMEINAGGFEGQKWDDLPRLFPEEFAVWRDDLPHFKAPNGESCAEVYDRMKRAAFDLVQTYQGKTIVLVSHGCAVKNLLCALSGLPILRIFEIPWVENTSVSQVCFDESMQPQVVWMNDTQHLNGVFLPTPVYWEGKQ